eukprot:jgi/Botrbrau1/15728/Bobra.4_1s0097.1
MALNSGSNVTAANNDIERFEIFVDKQIETQGSNITEDINQTISSVIAEHYHAEEGSSPTSSSIDHVGLVRKIIRDAEMLLLYDKKVKDLEANTVEQQLQQFAALDRGIVQEAAIDVTDAIKSTISTAGKAIHELGSETLFDKEQQVMKRRFQAEQAVQPLRDLVNKKPVRIDMTQDVNIPEKLKAASRFAREQQQSQLLAQTGDVLYPAEGTRTENVPTTRKGELSAGQIDANVPF